MKRLSILAGLFALAFTLPGLAQGTLVKDIQPPYGAASSHSHPERFTALRDRVVFSATNIELGQEPWVSDGTEPGTVLLADIHPTGASFPHSFTLLKDRVLFLARDADAIELWKTDGTPAGTVQLEDIAPALQSGAGPMASNGDVVFFFVNQPAGNALWKSDGTTVGTGIVTTIGTLDLDVEIAIYNEELYFSQWGAFDGSNGLWKSNGTAAGTVHVLSPWTDIGGDPRNYRVAGDYLFFTALTPDGRELWRTDGTDVGTILLKDIYAGSISSSPTNLVALDNGQLLCSARSPSHANGLWKSDGTPGATVQILAPPPIGELEGGLVSFGDEAWFIVPQFSQDNELWTTDGTEVGTHLLTAGAAFSSGLRRIGSGKLVAWTGLDPGLGAGLEPFISNGRFDGTGIIADVFPGSSDSLAGGYTRAGNRVYFHADDGVHSTELHAFDLSDHGGWVAEPFGSGCGASGPSSLVIEGRMLIGSTFRFEVKDAAPGAPVAFLYSQGSTHVDLGACNYYLPQAALFTIGTSDACGELSLTRTVPNVPAFIGVFLSVQALAISSGGPFLGVGGLTNPLEIIVGS